MTMPMPEWERDLHRRYGHLGPVEIHSLAQQGKIPPAGALSLLAGWNAAHRQREAVSATRSAEQS